MTAPASRPGTPGGLSTELGTVQPDQTLEVIMWTETFLLQTPLMGTILRSVLMFVTVPILIRLAGKRGLAEMGAFELDQAIRSQNGDDVSEVEHGELTPTGKMVLPSSSRSRGRPRLTSPR